MTTLAQINIYPIKSLDATELSEVEVLQSGALRDDRRWAIVDAEGRVVNGKRTAAIHSICAEFATGIESVTLSHPAIQSVTFEFASGSSALSEWLSEALQTSCRLMENRETGFPDDHNSPGPTLVSTGTLEEVARWFALSPREVLRRFRANLVIDAPEPFWEDRLVGDIGQPVPFAIGDVRWLGVNPCQRCVVPSRDSHTGVVHAGFQRQFAVRRQASLPEWAPRARFDHFYRLTINTRLADENTASHLRVGDPLRHLAPRPSLL
ncbi:MAG: MOSC N-terminal beta barrel domain-containing protein [Pirellulales bacterium]